ncbi:hypothetical protein UT300012_30220 [Paraclostridium bifermentans]|uniref:hypothetical protein n=1 Tax=Paraclostridium bifermentans TaxID=1490 RepID=UPI001C12349D|nr:hypothetical protein [Paraclostridium bifermentans]MBS5953998.1 hypothetical protein [Paraclostridium bifermentans]MBU5289471.1 hypothetical protein [Paraclostridium bifermentans]
MYLTELKKILDIKWNNCEVVLEDSSWNKYIGFEVKANDFLSYAKDGYRDKSNRGMINALSNSKRAIDCQIDWILSYLGYDYLNFNESKYPEIKTVISEFELDTNVYKDSSIKLRFIQALGIVPIFLVSKIRSLRNKLEHEYILPNGIDIKESIEIAELFINSTENIIFNRFITDYSIGNKYDENKWIWESSHLDVSFNPITDKTDKITIRFIDDNDNELNKLNLKPIDKGYIYLIKSAITNDFSQVIKAFKYEFDEKYVNYKIKYTT